MPKTNQSYLQEYSFKDWRERVGYSRGQAAVSLGISESTYWRMEKLGVGGRLHAWACYGIEQYVVAQRATADPAMQPHDSQ